MVGAGSISYRMRIPHHDRKPERKPERKNDELDKLYRAPLSEFVFLRNALAAELKKAGDADGAKRVKALVKPNASAWAVNRLYWKEPLSFAALIKAGDHYRDTFTEKGAQEDAERERLDAVRDATGIARALLERSAKSASNVVMRRVETTLDALASYGSANPEPMDGRLTRDLEPLGFAALATLQPAPAPAAPQVAAAPETFIVYFDWDSAAVDGSGGRVIDDAVAAADSLGIADFSITGHADRSGPEDYNLNLSLRRADNVKAALIARGVQEGGISVAGRGEATPAITTDDGVREPANRRVEIILL